jgi:hypothetical protein
MNMLCFGTYAKTLQTAMKPPNSDKKVVELLLNYIIETADLLNKEGDPIYLKPSKISLYMNCTENVPENIRTAAALGNVISGAPGFFDAKIVNVLNMHLVDDLIENISTLIKNDSSVSDSKRNSLLSFASADTLGSFLANVFLYAICRQNIKNDMDDTTGDKYTSAFEDMDRIQELLSRIPKPLAIDMPAEPVPDEMVYVRELLLAYADAEGVEEISKDDLQLRQGYRNDFERRRKDYYAAETIRRASRDSFGRNDTDQFDVLKGETYDGVIDVHTQSFSDGFSRLKGVMNQAAALPISKCQLSRLDWIGNSEKKGVCHILVNEQTIKGWVSGDE